MAFSEPDQRRSLTGSIMKRGLRVVAFHPDDDDGATLANHLKRMGFDVQMIWPPRDDLPGGAELVFRALPPEERAPDDGWLANNPLPLVAVIGYENPTFIDQALRIGAAAIITTPIRASGLLSAVIVALSHARQLRQYAQRVASLERKLNDAKLLNEAKTILMHAHGIGEGEAYAMIRSQAMARRVSVDDICHSIVQAGELMRRIGQPGGG